jgi:hypothetical protein
MVQPQLATQVKVGEIFLDTRHAGPEITDKVLLGILNDTFGIGTVLPELEEILWMNQQAMLGLIQGNTVDYPQESYSWSIEQVKWWRRVFPFCHYPVYSNDEGWNYCGTQIPDVEPNVVHKYFQIHHIFPKRYATQAVPQIYGQHLLYNEHWNGIGLCVKHHNGRGYSGNLKWRDAWPDNFVPVVHPDVAHTYRTYGILSSVGELGEAKPFDDMFNGRERRIKEGIQVGNIIDNTYWNSIMDRAFNRINMMVVSEYKRKHETDRFPR